MTDPSDESRPHVVLIGGGIMSATLGVLLKRVDPRITIEVFERLDRLAAESSDAWNNAGTGHSALCELNYTPEREDGSVDCGKAIAVLEAFEISRQLWASLVEEGALPDPAAFIRRVPHVSFVRGEEGVSFLRKRWEALRALHPFACLEWSEDRDELARWMPLVMDGRDPSEPVAATRATIGTDVDFGALTRALFAHLARQEGVRIHLNHAVRGLDREGHAPWVLDVHDLAEGTSRQVAAHFVFVGAGGGALPLLEASGIPEGRGYGGFPVSGLWFRCINRDVIASHHAKVYGQAEVGAPPMSVPHLDSRVIDGEKALLFGPFAGFTTKFLKEGSVFDLPRSIHLDNLLPMLAAGADNVPLTLYLIEQVLQSTDSRLDSLHAFYPRAAVEDWIVQVAGQRVQIIKEHPEEGGVLQFGTEVVASEDGTLAALLGASPGASTAAAILLELMERCFSTDMASDAWQDAIRALIPSWGRRLCDDPALCDAVRARSDRLLRLG
jgi:malate dehydrogenase (quinone)